MFNKKKKETQNLLDGTASSISSVISKDVNFNGKLSSESGIRIEGKFEGELDIKGLLVIGEKAVVTCKEIKALKIIISGEVHSKIIADKIEIRATGKVWGDIDAVSFQIEEGAFLHGQVNMKESHTAESE